jgi:hypothetical protein
MSIGGKCLGSPNWVKVKNPKAPAVKREGRRRLGFAALDDQKSPAVTATPSCALPLTI